MPNINKLKSISGEAHIIGVAESNEIGKVPNKSPIALHAEAALNALEDAGLNLSDVDGLFTAGWSTLDIAEYLGINPKFTDSTSVGGSSFVIHVAHALSAIASGYCEVALITHGQSGRSDREPMPRNPAAPMAQYENPHGIIGPQYHMPWQQKDICIFMEKIILEKQWQKLLCRPENGQI